MLIFNLLFCFLIGASLCFYSADSPALQQKKPLILIDPGHGGKDRGARSHSLEEAKLTLKISKKLVAEINTNSPFHARLTRKSDETLSLTERVEIANSSPAELFVSIHLNSNPSRKAKGLEVYFQDQMDPSEQAMYLAAKENGHFQKRRGLEPEEIVRLPNAKSLSRREKMILSDSILGLQIHESSELAKAVYQNWEGHKRAQVYSIQRAPFYVISNLSVPSVLIELGFLTNSADRRALTNKSYQKRAVKNIGKALTSYLTRIRSTNDGKVLNQIK